MSTAPDTPAPPATSAAPRARLPRSARRKQLLDAASGVFVTAGYHAAAMDDIAERAGVSKPVLYQHFPSKLDLYKALLEQHIDVLVAHVRSALDSTEDNRERVQRAITAYFDFVDGEGANPEGAYRMVFESDLRSSDPEVRDLVGHSLQRCVEAIADTIAKDARLSAGEAELLSVGLVGLAEVGARWWLASGATPDERKVAKERAVELLVSLAWRGLSGQPRHS